MSQRVFCVVGAKGGVGATTLATKLVQRLPAHGERMIVDADLAGKRNLAVWYNLTEDLDVSRTVGAAAVAKVKDGFLVMELARTYEDGLIQTSSSLLGTLASLSEHALVVVDAPQPFAATVRPFVARAAKIIVVSEPSRLGIGAARALLEAMARAGIASSRIAFLLSDARGIGTVKRTDIERTLQIPVSAELPNERDHRFESSFRDFVEALASAPGSEP
jgi:MinD-like ATPase involved in chromosome partitioning or flagellar assembly